MRYTLSFLIFLFLSVSVYAQPTVTVLQSGKRVSFRGLSVVNDNVVWVSGSGGTVVRSVDGGKNWEWMTVPGYEKRDFRDIEAFDKNTAIIVGVAAPAIILKTKDGGKTWKKVYEDTAQGVFLDAMAFSTFNKKMGVVIGDPLPGTNQMYELHTFDKGDTWVRRNPGHTLNEGEAFFASSGTNLGMMANHPAIVSGGKHSRLFTNQWHVLPIMQGKESTGANSIALYEYSGTLKGVVVGGDFAKDTIASENCVLVSFNGVDPTFSTPQTNPHGYRSCVTHLTKNKLITCGTSGVDISTDGGQNWTLIDRQGFHVVKKARKGKAVFMAGGGGRIARVYGL